MSSSYNKRKRRLPEHETEAGFIDRARSAVTKQVDLTKDNFFSQLFGESDGSNQQNPESRSNKTKASSEGVVFQIAEANSDKNNRKERKASAPDRRIEPGMRYHENYYESVARSGENFSRRETREIKEQVRQIMNEIRKLASSSKELQVEFGQITVQQAPENPGKYYASFFDWLLIMLRQARQKVEDSKAWLDTVKSKSKKKNGYWEKSKKHGTSFSQSNERTVATSTG